MSSLTHRLADRTLRALRSPLLAPLNDVAAIDDVLAQVNPEWSLGGVRARIVEIREETRDTRTFVLRPNGRWQGHRAGQHVALEVEIDGRRLQRTFTVASAPNAGGTIELTIKRQARGRVTGWLHGEARVGMVVGLSPAAGTFTLPEDLNQPMLMISAGSGITPVMAMLRTLAQEAPEADVRFVHQCRRPDELIFGAELQALAARMPRLALHVNYSAESGRLEGTTLAQIAPDYASRRAFLCGPQGFMDAIADLYRGAGLETLLATESFTGPVLRAPASGAEVEVRCARSEQLFTATGAQPLLMEAEAAGLKPKHGCRIGICQSCKCRKREGTVQNVLTGEISSEPNQMIQLCVSVAKSDLTLDL